MFCLDHWTICHSAPDMTATFARLGQYMIKEKTNQFIRGHTAKYNIPDTIAKGQIKMMDEARKTHTTEEDHAEENVDEWAGLGDEMNIEFGDLTEALTG